MALDLINMLEVLSGIKQRHGLYVVALQKIGEQYQVFTAIRGLGMLIGAELTTQYHGKAYALLTSAATRGLIIVNAWPNVIHFTPSLMIEFHIIAAGMALFNLAVQEVIGG